MTAVAERPVRPAALGSPLGRAGRLVLRHPLLVVATLAVPLIALLVAMHSERWFPSGDLAQA